MEKYFQKSDKKETREGTDAMRGLNFNSLYNSWRSSTPNDSGSGPSWRSTGRIAEEIPSQKSWRNTNQQGHNERSTERFTPKLNQKELILILKMHPVDAFLEIMDNIRSFTRITQDQTKSHETVVLLIAILGKIHEVPMIEHLQSLVKQIFGSDVTFRNDILAYVRFAVDLEEEQRPNLMTFADQVWTNLETFCDFGKRIDTSANVWAYFARAICRILEGKKEKSLQKQYEIFSKIRDEIAYNWRYEDTTSATLQMIKQEPLLRCTKDIRKGKFANLQTYINFQMYYLKFYFLSPLFDGLKEFQELKDEEKNEPVVMLDESNIFPCVKLYKTHSPFLTPKGKFFILDLVPKLRVNDKLSDDVIEEIDESEIIIQGGTFVFLSTSSKFEDLIVMRVPFTNSEARDEGFLFVDIVRMENIKENIFNKDLFLVTFPQVFESKIHTINMLAMISTATFPMKEYLIDCEESAVLPDFENLQEFDCTLEKINLRAENYKDEELKALGMNERQFEAFRMAFTRNLTVIQGPPGTGKTAVALNIVKRLLANTSCKILLVSHKQYCIDQFVIRCSALTDKIKRIGWYFDIPEVDKFAIHEKVVNPRFQRLCKRNYAQYMAARDKLVETIRRLDNGGEDLSSLQDDIDNLQDENSKADQTKSLEIFYGCRDDRIIGMTSSGVAKYHELLEIIRPTVVIIEEAAVMPESQFVTTLTKYTQQLILMGDEIQAPYIQEVRFDIPTAHKNLFERLIEKNINNVRLNVQHRMHPDISDLLRETLYPDLVDGENVKLYEAIRGIPRNLFCVSHENLDAVPQETFDFLREKCSVDNDYTSSNDIFYEILFCITLANFLCQQGYKSHEIAILGTNESGILAMKSARKNFPSLKDAHFQTKHLSHGTEYRIVILYLVKAKTEDCLSLNIPTYVLSMLLSRAKEALYIVGDIEAYAKVNEKWRIIKNRLEAKEAIGSGLPIKCEKHGSEMIMRGPEDFLEFAEEGCSFGKCFGGSKSHPCLEII